jgi:circadian clock protein KaiC
MVDLLKSRGITALFTSLRIADTLPDSTDLALSSLMDAWIRLVDAEANGERNRILYIIKARGMQHSNQMREYRVTDFGIELIEPYIGAEGVLTGTARIAQESREKAAATQRRQTIQQRQREIAKRRLAIERQIAELQDDLAINAVEARSLSVEDDAHETNLDADRLIVAKLRGAIA